MALTHKERTILRDKCYVGYECYTLEENILINECYKYESIAEFELDFITQNLKDHATPLGLFYHKRIQLVKAYGVEIEDKTVLQVFKKAKEDFNKPLAICPECKSEYTSYLADGVNMCDSCNNPFKI